MADSSDVNTSASDESPAQRQARLRRERRQQKVTSGGKDRLQAIASLSGRTVAQMDEASAAANTAQQPTAVDDPDEVDISRPFAGQPLSRNESPAQPSVTENMNDPTMRLMQQMLGSDPSNPSNLNQPDANDPMTRLMQQVMSGQETKQQAPPSNGGYMWRLVHSLFALTLALYIALSSTFNGSKLSRSTIVSDSELGGGVTLRLFWMFATAELALQSTRYFVEKGRLPETGWLGMVGNVLPEPFKSYVAIMARYGVMWTTVVSDAMVVVFVLGALAWWKGKVAT
ncbi:hypothetical protein EV356DRAFT_512871 [Viridothelium virens]|uniref:GET complex, subunit GET2 n=1 Tax=Viridothelium virens TaxID=1048519 RepID=A0A6A6HF10_VIRVR|nr:hypothetical protein EV356DRAFT_512871 [Viridothelium virens]